MSKTIYLFFFLFAVKVSAQTEKESLCKEIYGKWETYYIQLPFGMDPKNRKDIWVFNENGILSINKISSYYTLEEDCTRLFIGSDSSFFSVEISKNSLFIIKTILPHESYVLHLKKIN